MGSNNDKHNDEPTIDPTELASDSDSDGGTGTTATSERGSSPSGGGKRGFFRDSIRDSTKRDKPSDNGGNVPIVVADDSNNDSGTNRGSGERTSFGDSGIESGTPAKRIGPDRTRNGSAEGETIKSDDSGRSANASGNPFTRSTVGETVDVESPKVAVKRTYAKRKKTGGGPLTANHVTDTVVGAFGAVASIRQAPHWNIQNPKHEVEPWAANAATIGNKFLEKVDTETAEKFAILGTASSVVLGVGTLVFMRMKFDMQLKQKAYEQQQSTLPDVDEFTRTDPTKTVDPTEFAPSKTRTPQAQSVHPKEKIIGLGIDRGGLT